MQTDEKNALQAASLWQHTPVLARQHLPLREAALLLFYHLRLLNWWLFGLMALGFLGVGGLCWLQLHAGNAPDFSRAGELSQFSLESGTGLFAGMLASALVVGDPLLEVTMATRTGIWGVAIWRSILSFLSFLCCAAIYLAWSLGNGISYAKQQGPLFLLLMWLAPVLVMGMLGLLASLVARNAALGTVIAAVPLAGSLFLYEKLQSIPAIHPFFISYTYSGGYDAPDWWTNRATLLCIALALAAWNWWWLLREERLLSNSQ